MICWDGRPAGLGEDRAYGKHNGDGKSADQHDHYSFARMNASEPEKI
jgi:hypothetical protein